MKLIGLLDSPYVRRVAISLQLLGLRFEHLPVSVFRGFAEFQKINPVVKAPTLVCDDGTVLMDSNLILEYAQALAHPRSLLPADVSGLRRDLRVTGLALAACEKAVQIIYERSLRPPEKVHAPWIERVTGQMLAAFGALEQELARAPLAAASNTISQAGVTAGVVWRFTETMLPEMVPAADYPHLAAFSAQVEALPEFKAAPHGESAFTQK
ncbi:MAG: glutathione S-transferase family protein [Burkholderiaceae bacterium]